MEPRLLRDACLVALRVAAEGEQADPRLPAPNAIRPVMGFSRLSTASLRRIQGAVDADDEFRMRVAEAADEETVGRAGWLWLHRPEGWEQHPVFTEPAAPGGDAQPAKPSRGKSGADALVAKLREAAKKADGDRRRAVEDLASVSRSLAAADAEVARLGERLSRLELERNEAVRAQKAVESALAESRRDLRLAREATRQAEAELLALRTAGSPPAPAAEAPDGIDRAGARAAVDAAASAAADLASALADAAHALGSSPTDIARSSSQRGGHHRSGPKDRRRSKRRGSSGATLPPGLLAGSPEADKYLAMSPTVMLLVDGYNLARTAWSGLDPEAERRRTVTLLEEVAARSCAPITVVFDGDDASVAPAASRSVRVAFSATGVTADDDIAALLATIPAAQPVAVVSTDKEVAADARSQGAATLTSAAFLAAIGR
ncbi:MAG: NYN domain-containing protein [Aquihabitans sp.]